MLSWRERASSYTCFNDDDDHHHLHDNYIGWKRDMHSCTEAAWHIGPKQWHVSLFSFFLHIFVLFLLFCHDVLTDSLLVLALASLFILSFILLLFYFSSYISVLLFCHLAHNRPAFGVWIVSSLCCCWHRLLLLHDVVYHTQCMTASMANTATTRDDKKREFRKQATWRKESFCNGISNQIDHMHTHTLTNLHMFQINRAEATAEASKKKTPRIQCEQWNVHIRTQIHNHLSQCRWHMQDDVATWYREEKEKLVFTCI